MAGEILPSCLTPHLVSPLVWIVTATLLCAVSYYNGLYGELVHDDIFAIRDNTDLRPSTSWTQLWRDDFWGEPMSSPTSHKSYRPITVLTFRLNYILHKLEPFGYHVVNVGLHIVATMLLGAVCRCVVWGCVEGAYLTMCLFAVHPVHTEAVTGIVGRADVLACIFFFLCLLLYWSYLTTPPSKPAWARALKLLGCLVTGAAAMLSKEHGVTVLGVCLALDVGVVNRKLLVELLTSKRTMSTSSKLRPLTVRCAILTLTIGVLLVVRIWLLNGQLPVFGRQDNPASFADSVITRALSYSHLLYFNAKLLLYPAVLCYDYQMGSIPLVESLMDPRNITTVIFYIVIACLFISSCYRNDPVTLLGLLLIVVPFLPASNLFIRVGFVVAERILYIPSAGYCVLVVHGAMATVRRYPSLRPITLLLLTMLLGAFITRTITRNSVWDNRESLFRSGLHTIPHNAKIHFNYANFLKDSGRTREAIEHYETALQFWPEHAVSHNNLGTLLTHLTVAEAHFRAAIQHSPGHYRALCNLGSNLHKQGRLKEAETSFRRSLSLNAHYTDTLMGLAGLLADSGRGQEGRGYMEQAAAIAPDNADVMSNMATYLWRIGSVNEAIEWFQGVLQLSPAHHPAMVGLARSYRTQGNNKKAENTFKRALSLRVDPDTLHLLAALYHNTGSLEQAAATFQQALTFEPYRVDTLCGYGQTLLQLGRYGDVLGLTEDALDHTPLATCIHTLLASTHHTMGHQEKALHHSSIAMEMADTTPSLLEALQTRGRVLKDLKRFKEAERALQTRGRVLKDLKRFKEAERIFRQAVDLSPTSAGLRLNLGALLHLLGNYTAARNEYKIAGSLDPNNNLVNENLKRLDRLEKKIT